MKIEQATLEVTRSGTFKEQGFAIANNAKAFDILSSKIYTDVPLAIVRELSTNASDSHTDAGCASRPFDVHLPNSLEPWFMIRDYGTGLSPENVESVYTTYFKSTRSGSDDFTGCLGLGSKSPFAYTDQFTIVSNWNGRKFTYSAFKNESGCPSLALLSEVETDEENGLEIRIAIKQYEGQQFVEAARKVYRFFKVRPNVVGATLKIEDNIAVIRKPDYTLYNEQNGGRISVVMGQVCYQVSSNKISSDIGYQAHITLQMPMGACSIAASREEIHYDDKTIANVRQALLLATDDARAELEARVSNETCVLNKLQKLQTYRNLIGRLSIQGMASIPGNEGGKYTLRGCSIRRGDKLFISQCHGDFHGNDHHEKIVFIEDDMEITQNAKNRLRQYLHSLHNTAVFLAKIEDLSRFQELFGDVTTKVSLLPDVPRAIRNTDRAGSRSKPIKLLNESSTDNMVFDWKNCTEEIDATDACCVTRDGNWVVWEGEKIRPSQIREIANLLGFKHIYGISDKRYHSLRVKYNLPELTVEAKARAEALIKTLDTYALAKFQHNCDTASAFVPKKLKGLSTECDDLVKLHDADIDDMRMYQRLCNHFKLEMPTAPNYQEAFYKKYPILVAIEWYDGKITMDMVINYIKLVEASLKEQI